MRALAPTLAATCLRTACALVAALAGPGRAQIVTENAGVLSPETPILKETLSVLAAEHLDELRWNHQFIWSFDRTRELKLNVPLVWHDATFEAGSGTDQVDLSGLGDVSLRFKHSLWQRDDVMESTRWAILGELVAPTGDDDAQAGGMAIPGRLQLGAGTAFTLIRDRNRFAVEAFFRQPTRHDGVQLGSSIDLNLAYWRRLAPAAFEPGASATELRGVVELLGTYRFPSDVAGMTAGDDAGLVWLAPGVQVFPGGRVLFEANVQLPIHQDLDDELGDRRWAASLVVKFLF